MARRFIVKDHDDEFVTAADDLEELIENLEEQAGDIDPEDWIDEFEF